MSEMRIDQFNSRKMKWNFLLMIIALLIIALSALTAFAQNSKEVRGKVTDLDGKIITVSVRFKGGVTLTDK